MAAFSSPNSFRRDATLWAQGPFRARTSTTQSWARFQYSTKVGLKTKLVGSPSSGNTSTLKAALPPMGARYRALATVKSQLEGEPKSTRHSKPRSRMARRTAAHRRSRSRRESLGISSRSRTG